MTFTQLTLTGLLLMFTASVALGQPENLKVFPPAADGMVRYVIQLPHKERGEEDDFQVELIVGKTILTDGVNRAMLSAKIADKPLEGWGFTFYEVEKFGPTASTLIGVPEGTPKAKHFVAAPSRMIRYNSRVPVVVYVPADGEVRYRIWRAEKTEIAKKN